MIEDEKATDGFFTEQILKARPYEAKAVGSLSSEKPSKKGKQDMRDTAWEVRTNSKVTFFQRTLDMVVSVLADQQELFTSALSGHWM